MSLWPVGQLHTENLSIPGRPQYVSQPLRTSGKIVEGLRLGRQTSQQHR